MIVEGIKTSITKRGIIKGTREITLLTFLFKKLQYFTDIFTQIKEITRNITE